MVTIVLPLVAALAHQQPRQRPASPSTGVMQIQPAQTELRTPFDTTKAMIIEIGQRVAELRSSLDVYRRAAFNDPDGALMETVGLFVRRSHEVAEAAERGRRTLCRRCLSPSAQRAVEDYRAYLPTLARVARQVEARAQHLAAGDSSAPRLRRDVLPANNRIVAGLRPYEAQLQQVRIAFGWAGPASTPRRP